MNAIEARKMSNDNLPKLVEANVLDAKNAINLQIAGAVKGGKFSTGLPIKFPVKIQKDVIDQLITHFENLGYKVQVSNSFTTKWLSVSWAEEE
jgi:hypothetical protein